MTNNKYDWKKTALKVVIATVEIAIAGTIVYFTENVLFMGLIPILEGIRNFVKNYKK